MADIKIQEPSDLDPQTITDQTAADVAVLVYSRIANSGGIKQLGLLPWKEYLNYDYKRVVQLAQCVGIPTSEYDPVGPFVPPSFPISTEISNIAEFLGMNPDSTIDPTEPTMAAKVSTLQYDVGSSEEGHETGLQKKVKDNRTDIDALSAQIGGSGGGSGSTISERLNALDNKTDATNLRVTANETAISNINTEIGSSENPSPTSINGKINAINTEIGDPSSSSTDNINGKINSINNNITTINNNITTINNEIGSGTDPNSIIGRLGSIEDDITQMNSDITQINEDIAQLNTRYQVWEYSSAPQDQTLEDLLGEQINKIFTVNAIRRPAGGTTSTYMGTWYNGDLIDMSGTGSDFFTIVDEKHKLTSSVKLISVTRLN